jgi:hypothetical protein
MRSHFTRKFRPTTPNRGEIRAGVLNLSIPGSFESHMPAIAQWFAENPSKDAGI